MKIAEWTYQIFDDVLDYDGGTDLRVNCPFCSNAARGADTNHHLYISLMKEVCHCFRCEYRNTWLGLVSDVEGISIGQAAKLLSQYQAIVPLYKLVRQRRTADNVCTMPETFMTIAQALKSQGVTHTMGQMAAQYMRNRILHYVSDWEQYYTQWGIWDDIDGWGKIVFPVEKGWWQYRHIASIHSGPKYVSCSYPKNDVLYNWQALERWDEVCIAEGVLSAACIGPHAVGLCGKRATPQQLRRLARAPVSRYVLCLDPDAMEDSILLANSLSSLGRNVEIRRYLGGDPAASKRYMSAQVFLAGQRYSNTIQAQLELNGKLPTFKS